MTIDDLLNSFLSLDADQRHEFLDRAYEAAQAVPFDVEWLEEIRRRSAAADAGQMPLHDWEVAREQVHSKHFPNA